MVGRYAFTDKTTPTLTWGRHGGPLAGGTQLRRWTPPSTPTGALTLTTTPLDSAAPVGMAFVDFAVDLPFGDWTALGLQTGSALAGGGALWLARSDGHVEVRLPTHAAALPVGLAEAGGTRLIFGDLLPPEVTSSGYRNDLEAIDGCRADACAPRIAIDPGNAGFSGAIALGTFADPLGNVFLASREGRGAPGDFLHLDGYAATAIAPGACPTRGVGAEAYGSVLPVADGERVFFTDVDFDRGVDSRAYHLDASGALVFAAELAPFVAPRGVSRAALITAIVRDDARRIWLLDASATFWVLARR